MSVWDRPAEVTGVPPCHVHVLIEHVQGDTNGEGVINPVVYPLIESLDGMEQGYDKGGCKSEMPRCND